MAQCEQEATSHDITGDDATGSIRVYCCASIEEVSSNFVRVEDNYWLTSSIQVDQITWSGALFRNEQRANYERTDRISFAILQT